jgi:hypothetical protein
MMKMKLCSVVLLILGAGVIASAAEVINIDLNGYNSNIPYIGNGAYDVGDSTIWKIYYGGFGAAIGSDRTESLVPATVPEDELWYASVYAAQVWIGDDGQNHGYLYGTGLMDDGFVKDGASNPKINLFGDGAYQGVYDIYVYGSEAGDFILNYYGTQTTKSVDGDANEGMFELGHNYVVFEDVDINNIDSVDVNIAYTNVINGLQLVKQKEPFVIEPNSLGLIRIPAGDWDVAGETNRREVESNIRGPDTFFDDVNGIGSVVGYLDAGEFMEYDIVVDEANEGQYEISLGIMGGTYGFVSDSSMKMYLDDEILSEVTLASGTQEGDINDTSTVVANLYAGNHTVKWYLYAGNTGMNIVYVKFNLIGDAACPDVVTSGFTLAQDLNGDCVVDLQDLYLAVDDWVNCNNPDSSQCF